MERKYFHIILIELSLSLTYSFYLLPLFLAEYYKAKRASVPNNTGQASGEWLSSFLPGAVAVASRLL